MKLFRSIGVALWAWRESLAHVLDLRLWSPLLLITLLRLLGMIALVFFHHPRLVTAAEPVVRFLGGGAATHYPEHLYLLPRIFQRFDSLLILVAGGLAAGMVTLRFARAFGSTTFVPDRRGALRHLPAILALTAVAVGVDQLVPLLIALVPESVRSAGMIYRLFFLLVHWGILTAAMTLLAYGMAAIVVRGRSVVSAISESVRLFRREPVTTLTLVAVPMTLLFPLFVAGEIDLAERGVPPEGLVILVFARILGELGLGFSLLGSVTCVYVWLTEVNS